jgi:hypothetical protein
MSAGLEEEVDFNEVEEEDNYNNRKESFGNDDDKSSSHNNHQQEGRYKRDASLDVVVGN